MTRSEHAANLALSSGIRLPDHVGSHWTKPSTRKATRKASSIGPLLFLLAVFAPVVFIAL